MRCREIFSLFQQPPHHGVPPAHQPALRARRQVQLGRLRLRAQEELRPPHRRRHGQVAAAVGEAKVRHHPRGAARRLSDAEVSVVYAEEELEFAFSRLSHEIGLMPPLDMILWPTHSEFFTRLIMYGPIRFDLEMVSLLIDTKSSFQFFQGRFCSSPGSTSILQSSVEGSWTKTGHLAGIQRGYRFLHNAVAKRTEEFIFQRGFCAQERR